MRRHLLRALLVVGTLGSVAAPGALGSAPELPGSSWPEDALVRYFAVQGPAGRVDHLQVRRDGTATVARSADGRRTRSRLLCLSDSKVKDLRRLLRRARRLKEFHTQPYPTAWPQGVTFGRRGQHGLRTFRDESLPKMRGKLRRKLFRRMEALRDRTWDSNRTRPCK